MKRNDYVSDNLMHIRDKFKESSVPATDGETTIPAAAPAVPAAPVVAPGAEAKAIYSRPAAPPSPVDADITRLPPECLMRLGFYLLLPLMLSVLAGALLVGGAVLLAMR